MSLRAGAIVLLVSSALLGLVTLASQGVDDTSAAHLWVEVGAGSCVRSASAVVYEASASPDARCGSFDEAYDAANASAQSSVIYVRGGTYGDQPITGNRSSAHRIILEAAPGELVRVGGVTLGQLENTPVGPDYLTIKGLTATEYGGSARHAPNNKRRITIFQGSTHVMVVGNHFGSLYSSGAKDLTVRANKFGPCWAGASMTGDPFTQDCRNFKLDGGQVGTASDRRPERVLVENNEFYDFRLGPSCFTVASGGTHTGSPSNPDCHYECVFLNGGTDLTFRGNVFRACAFMNIFSEDLQRFGYANLVIENNALGTPISYGAGAGRYDTPSYSRSDALAIGCKNTHPGYTGLKVRNNSFARNTGFDMTSFGLCQTATGITVTGNIMRRPHCSPQATYGWNVYNAVGSTGTCSPSDVNIGGTSFSFYANDTLTPTNTADFKLAGPAAAPDALLPASACPAHDAFNNQRATNGRCDAGIHER